MSFATTLNFTSANEDGQTELDALSLSPNDRVLCLTASGARPLDLLLADPGEIVALDINPAQNELLRLKIAAFRTLSDGELYAYLGLVPSRDRLSLHQRVNAALNADSRTFWDTKFSTIRTGVWHAGRWEKVLKLGARGTRLIRGRSIDELFDAPSLEVQSAIWADKFDDWIWRQSIRILSARWFWTRIIGEPGGNFLPGAQATEDRLTGSFRRAAENFLFRDSDFATLVFRGHHTTDTALPLHLQPQNLNFIRERLDRITIETGGLAELSPERLGDVSAFSLSDFSSYCDAEIYRDCWQGILSVARPGARFCERTFMNPLDLSATTDNRARMDPERSAALTKRDRAIIYDVRAGVIE